MLEPSLEQRLRRVESLPTIPPILLQALHLLENPEVSASAVAELIERDQALTARLLRIANSPFYGFPRKVTTIRLAIALLGNDTLRELLMGTVAYDFVRLGPNHEQLREELWKYSLYCAVACRWLARRLGYRPVGEAFVAGLLHDIGILLAAAYLPEEFAAVFRYQARHRTAYCEAELAVLGTTHAELGFWLAERWGLPELLAIVMRDHHMPDPPLYPSSLPPNSPLAQLNQPLTALAACAEYLAHHAGLRAWSGEEQLRSPLYFPTALQQHLVAHGVLYESGEPEPAILEELHAEYLQLANIPW